MEIFKKMKPGTTLYTKEGVCAFVQHKETRTNKNVQVSFAPFGRLKWFGYKKVSLTDKDG